MSNKSHCCLGQQLLEYAVPTSGSEDDDGARFSILVSKACIYYPISVRFVHPFHLEASQPAPRQARAHGSYSSKSEAHHSFQPRLGMIRRQGFIDASGLASMVPVGSCV